MRHPRHPSTSSHARLSRRGRVALVLVGALLLAAGAACSDDGEPTAATATTGAASGTTSTPSVVAGTETTDSSAPDATTSTTGDTSGTATPETVDPALPVPANAAGLTTAVYWVRPAGDDGPRDLPGYQDPASAPYPILVYGSVTNTTASAIGGLTPSVLWRGADGTVSYVTDAILVLPDGTAITSVDPGQTADLVASVPAAAAGPYAALAPEFVVVAQP